MDLGRRNIMKLLFGGAAGAAAKALVPIKEESEETESNGAYVHCSRCNEILFLGDIAANADAVKCPYCGVTTLLGCIEFMRSKRLKVARQRDR